MSDRQLAIELLPDHQSWCHATGHAECCAGECDCGIDESRDAVAQALADERVVGYRAGVADAEQGIYVPGSEALAEAEPTDEHREIASSLNGHSAGLIANALAEAEARGRAEGRAEMAAKVEGLCDLADGEAKRLHVPWPGRVLTADLRALLADTEGA